MPASPLPTSVPRTAWRQALGLHDDLFPRHPDADKIRAKLSSQL
jgi:hypothetical protein